MEKINASILIAEPMPYGNKICETDFIKLSNFSDIAVDECAKHAFVANENGLAIYDLSTPSHPTLISELKGLGNSRQIVFQDSYVYITSRSDGLYIIDVHDLKNPKLMSHFDTVELATGLDVNGSYCFVTCQHLGIEIINISDPINPQYISSIPSGEAQSVCSDGNFLYIGDWINKSVHISDISDPYNPISVSTFLVDGYADGIYVSSGYCYVATGHHSAKLKNRIKYDNYTYVTTEMLADGYGCGHRLELFYISCPYEPEYVSSLKFPPFFVNAPDTWRVIVSQNYAFVCDTFNGLFVIDVCDIFITDIYC